MIHIHLDRLRFRGFHGVFEEERVLGNDYEVDLSIAFNPTSSVLAIDETIDYTAVYNLVKSRMMLPCPLLETLVMDITAEIRRRYARVEKIRVSIKKLYPPVNSFEGSVGVSFEWNK